jgi:hypothetical protein
MAKGHKTGGGSRAGIPNKATADLKAMILGALDDAGGQQYLADQAMKCPGAFLTLIGKVLPMQLENGPGGLTVRIITGVRRAPNADTDKDTERTGD